MSDSRFFISTLERFDDTDLWDIHIPIPMPEAEAYIDGNNRRVICLLNDKLRLQCALMPREGNYFILINKAVHRQLELSIGDSIKVQLIKDTSEYGMEMPESFRVLLDQDDEGRKFFQTLTPGKQRSLIYIVSRVKNIDSQLSKGLAILDHLKARQGKLDFKGLQTTIKAYHRQRKKH